MAALLWNNADAAAAKLQELSPKFTLQEDRDIVQTMLADLAANKRLQYSDMALTDSGEAGVLQARSHITSSTFQAASKVRTDANKLIDDINRLAEEDGKQAEASASAALATVVICCLLVIVLGSVLAAFISRRITAAVHRLVARARRIAEGDLSGTDEETKLTDEIGELARSFAAMVSYLQEMAAISEAIAGGDLANEVKSRSARDTLGNAFARMTEGLRTLVRGVRDSAAQVASGSCQVAAASEEAAKVGLQASSAIDEVTSTMHEMSLNVESVVKNTQVQAASVSETAASIDQMVASIQRVADTSGVLLDISKRSRQEVENGVGSMDKATDGLNRMNTSIHSSAEIIDVLGHRANEIDKIIEVIDDLAEQTNLLALNAAIEAARAGEHGLGFAVVADEVRKLAEKSARSAKEISELIQSIQKEARKAVENMEKSTGIVNEGLDLNRELGSALKKISDVVAEVYKFAQEIGGATNEQSTGSSQIAQATTRLNEITHEINCSVEEQSSGTRAVVKAMERMRELAEQSSSSSSELAASAEQMSKMSASLLHMMDSFKLGPGDMLQRPGERRAAAARAHF
jgi:methyl-accepting chemotaxis protein